MARRLFDTLKKLRDVTRPAPPARPPVSEAVGPKDHVAVILGFVELGDLGAALEAAVEGCTAFPGYADLWFLRFNLLMRLDELELAGDALRQIVASDPLNGPGAGVCLEILSAEAQRRRVLAGGEPADLPHGSSAAVAHCQAALLALGRGDRSGAEREVQASRAAAPRLAGDVDDTPFSELRDVDDPLGPVLELLLPGRYQWVPLEGVAWIEVLPIRTFLDFLWVPAHVELRTGVEIRAHIPGIYAGTGAREDDRLRLGRETAWEAVTPGLSRAFGQRRYQTDGRLIELTGVRTLNFAAR